MPSKIDQLGPARTFSELASAQGPQRQGPQQQDPQETEKRSRYSEATLKRARRWVAKKDQVGASKTAYFVRDLHDADFFGNALIPTIKDSIGGCVIGGIATVLGNIRRRIRESQGIAVPRQVKMELSSAPDHWARPPKGTFDDVKDNLKYTAAMGYVGNSDRQKSLLSSIELTTEVANQANRTQTYEVVKTIVDENNEEQKFVKPKQSSDIFPKAYQAVTKSLESHQHWNFVPICQDSIKDWRIGGNTKVQKFFHNLPSEVKDNLNEHGTYTHPYTGNVISLLYDTESEEIVISHGATGATDNTDDKDRSRKLGDTQFWSNIDNWFSMFKVPASVKQAIAFSTLVRDAAARAGIVDREGNPNVVDVGHSRGGLMAQAAALANEGRAVCSNAEPMGPAVQRAVGLKYNTKKAASTKILHLSHENDYLSTQTNLRRLGQVFRFITGLPTQASAGKFITLPGIAGELGPKGTPVNLGPLDKKRDTHASPFNQMIEASYQFKRRSNITRNQREMETLALAQTKKDFVCNQTHFTSKYPKEIQNSTKLLKFHLKENPDFKRYLKDADCKYENRVEDLETSMHWVIKGDYINNMKKSKEDVNFEKLMFELFDHLTAFLAQDIENIGNKPVPDLMRACEGGVVLSPFKRPPLFDQQQASRQDEFFSLSDASNWHEDTDGTDANKRANVEEEP